MARVHRLPLSRKATRPLRRIRLFEPQVDPEEVRFHWELTPRSDFYLREEFSLQFPPGLDPRRVTRGLWWHLMMLCLYTHWAFLRPCRVELPVELGPGEREFWERMVENIAAQLESYGSARCRRPVVRIHDRGPRLPAEAPADLTDRAAVAFSGGKDSLVTAALLAELTERPLLVTTTSPVTWVRDMVGDARERAIEEITTRLPVELVELRTDFRTCWNPFFAAKDGGRLPVNQLTDLPLFQAVTLAAGAAGGAAHAFMASEADCQYSLASRRRVLQHCEFTGSAATQASLDALFSRFAMRQGGLTFPLHMPQVQQLLYRRYPTLAELQVSCYDAPEGTRACGTCDKCLQIALVTLAEGISPAEIGIDPLSVLCASADRRLVKQPRYGNPRLHESRAPRDHIVRCLQDTPVERIAGVITADTRSVPDPRLGEALAAYGALRSQALVLPQPAPAGYVKGLMELIHSDLRDPLTEIYGEHFPPVPDVDFEGILDRSRALSRWITRPLHASDRGRMRD